MVKIEQQDEAAMLMNSSSTNRPHRAACSQAGRSLPRVVLAAFLLGAALAYFGAEYAKRGSPEKSAAGLSSEALDLLRQLKSPVQIQFYSVLPAGSASESEQQFSQRVDRLLSALQDANPAEISVSRNLSAAGTNADAAAASGLRAFNLDKGEACFLGIAVASGAQKESLPQLQPEWEPALASDLVRTILRVAAAATPPAVAKSAPIPAAVNDEVARLIPDIAAMTPAEADRIFRQDFVNQCAKAGAEMETQINAAAQEVAQAQAGGSPAGLETARKKLAQVQLEQTEKLKEIAAHLQLQLAAFQQMKAATTNSTK